MSNTRSSGSDVLRLSICGLGEVVCDIPRGTLGAVHAANTPQTGPVRYRCNACGNLTRFDVIVVSRTKSFHHYSIGGELTVESVDVLDQRVEEAACRWCGHGKAVVAVTGAVPESPGLPDGSSPPNPTD